tara:strand:- start:1225 stop:2130 length:906 start_codon:yes stop_codon:yes gene_type:complete
MNTDENPIKKKLYGYKKHFSDFCNLFNLQIVPKILMLSGKKGQGKFTFIQHIIAYYFDKNNYDINLRTININNKLYDLKDNSNIDVLYFPCDKNIKIDDIRELRKKLQKSSLSNNNRFIIFDDVENLNINCVNALLKTIEEPSKTNYFILINNENKPLIDTIRSRTIEIKFFLNKNENSEIIKNLISDFKVDYKSTLDDYSLTPGKFLKYNEILNDEKLNFNDKTLINLQKLLKLHKVKKNSDYLNLSIYLINRFYFNKSKDLNLIEECNNERSYISKKIYDYDRLNLNQSSLISELENYF